MTEIPCSPDDISYVIEDTPDGRRILFMPCGFTSYHPMDIANKYCIRCHRWMDLLEFAREMKAVLFPSSSEDPKP